MAPSSRRVPSPFSYPSLSPSTYIPSTESRTPAASSSVPPVSTTSSFSLASSSLSSPSSDLPASYFLLLCTALSIHLCTIECVATSMTASRPAHSCRFPHAVFAWYSSALITILARPRQSVSPIPTGRTPELLSSATRQQDIIVR